MFAVTPEALERLSMKLTRRKAANDEALRARCSHGRWKLRVDQAKPEDTAFAHDGRKVLLLDRAAAKQVSAMTLIVAETESGPRLRLRRNPAKPS